MSCCKNQIDNAALMVSVLATFASIICVAIGYIILHHGADIRVYNFIFVKYILLFYLCITGHRVAQLVKAPRYKPEGRGFDSQWCYLEFFNYIILPVAL